MIIGRRIIALTRVASTMEEIDELAAAGEPEGIVITAEEQTAGRGRAGRSWQVPAGTSLLCSILLRPPVSPDRLTTLPLLIGVAVAEAIEAVAPVTCQLKWPNDVWIDGRKVAGILMTSRAAGSKISHVALGIGINVNVGGADLPPGATSILEETRSPVDRAHLLDALVTRCDDVYREFNANPARVDLDRWRARAALVGDVVEIRNANERVLGVMIGVSEEGALLLLLRGGELRRIVAGDLIRGPMTAGRVS